MIGAISADRLRQMNDAIESRKPKPPRSCNRHASCDTADAAFKARHGKLPPWSFHCSSEDCEECFGN